jgi:hypothetical protein
MHAIRFVLALIGFFVHMAVFLLAWALVPVLLSSLWGGDWMFLGIFFGLGIAACSFLFWAISSERHFRRMDKVVDRYIAWLGHVGRFKRIPGYTPLAKRGWTRFRYRNASGAPRDRFLSRRRRDAADLRILTTIHALERASGQPARLDVISARSDLGALLFTERFEALQHPLERVERVLDAALEPEDVGYHVTWEGREWAGLTTTAKAPRRMRPSLLA